MSSFILCSTQILARPRCRHGLTKASPSTLTLRKRPAAAALLIGGEDRGHLQLLRRVGLIPVTEIAATSRDALRAMSAQRRQQFYAESWLLVRQLIADNRLKIESLSTNLEILKTGGGKLTTAFGEDATAIQTALTRSLAERSLRFATTSVAASADPLPATTALSMGHAFGCSG